MNIFHKVTLQNMKKSRTRTMVTIIGVILSTAMITAVATFALSLQQYMVKGAAQKYGDWQVEFFDTSADFAQKQIQKSDVSKAATFENIGYGKLEGGKNPNKPYLFVAGFNQKTFNTLPIKMISGRLPKNSQEVVIPAHVAANGGVKYAVGEKLTLSIGARMAENKQLNQHVAYDDKQNPETLTKKSVKTYKIVGICERPGFEEQSAPGYTLITIADKAEQQNDLSVFVTLKNPRKARSYAKSAANDRSYTFNDEVLRFTGASDDKVFNLLLYSIGTILVVLIMLGSIFLIYNSFTISLNERTRQFGILSSVGATPNQLRNSVLFEGLCIGALGIPLGVILGIGSIQIVIGVVAKNFNNVLYANIPLVLKVSLPILVAAAFVSLLTILISAYLPARKAANTPVMESIRQSNEVKVSAKDVKVTKFSERIYGLEGMLALKNFKRNKKRYRTIILSLAFSVVLFVSAQAFGNSLQQSAKQMVVDTDYDIVFSSSEIPENDLFRLYDKFQKVEGITSSSYQAMLQYTSQVESSDFSARYRELETSDPTKQTVLKADVQFIEDKEYLRFIKRMKLPVKEYTGENGKMLAVAKQRVEKNGEKNELINLFAKDMLDLTIVPEINGKPSPDQQQMIKVKFVDTYPLDTLPRTTAGKKPYVFMLVAPYQMKANFSPAGIDQDLGVTFLSKNAGKSTAEMKKIIQKEGITVPYELYNVHEIFDQSRNTIFVVNIFSYVFVAMISLIAIANVFNTISTNIKLRRRELAMLRSVGMTDRDFNKMMIFECIFYGSRSLLLGIPSAGIISWLIYRGMVEGGAEITYQFPWGSMLIGVLGVFLIVSITMLYAVDKIKKENIIEALRDDLA
ncbi:FtsX-like permease family protein [Enterococcus hulanensis]|uniref:ABC transporter permease n=1 Tax=Enterococcus hulanensis TaxID=2559929 RepID=UPI001A8E6392|nr:FtsX-like permease family protein [Enterococcus hulanensis]MBO0458021.1 FtsX-like permease family protein [Enterococcus hulanensis]